jgi:hypothetical protein
VILDLQRAVREGSDRVIEKSRDMGASWMVLLVFHHEWLDPRGGGDFLVGSRVEDYVDRKGDMRTLFEKLRYAHYKLPKWIQPQGFQRRVHDTYGKLVNPESGASITGESNNPNFSTGGRYAGILYDEFAKWKESDTAAWTAGGDADASATALAAAIESSVNSLLQDITASAVDNIVTVSARTKGIHGNSYTLSETDNATGNFTISGSTFEDGTDTTVQAAVRTAVDTFFGRTNTDENNEYTVGFGETVFRNKLIWLIQDVLINGVQAINSFTLQTPASDTILEVNEFPKYTLKFTTT